MLKAGAKKKGSATKAVLKELRAFGLRFPGAHLKSPWPGHLDLAVKDKTFAYLSIEGEPFGISCKLQGYEHDKIAIDDLGIVLHRSFGCVIFSCIVIRIDPLVV
jgi:hypothetical protein